MMIYILADYVKAENFGEFLLGGLITFAFVAGIALVVRLLGLIIEWIYDR